MLGHLIRGPILGVIAMLALVINTLVIAIALYLFALLKMLSPTRDIERFWGRRVEWVASSWFKCNLIICWLLLPTQWNIELPDTLDRKKNYLITCNHQSWVDIVALFAAMIGHVPFFRFFLKEDLRKIPVLARAWIALDYPFMKRYSKAEIAANPELAGKDLEATKLACEKYSGVPVTIVNFMEGTRFKQKLHSKQQSPYKNLLKPKAGGISFVLSSMGEQVDSLLNVTILYPDGVQEFWPFLCGHLPRVTVIVHEQDIPKAMTGGDYANDDAFRGEFQSWVSDLWAEKDDLISARLEQNAK